MADLISRQAAIDAAIEATDSWEGVCSIGRQKRIENYINSLPFAPGMDLISRRAAIDICANVIDLFRGQFGAGVLVAIKESIEELPSAQSEIIRCRNCRYYNSEEKECLDLLGHGRRWEEDDFCSYGVKMEEVTS